MNNEEMYFSVYNDIEREVLELTKSIHFTDDQSNVYSIKIADLIIRCSVELEAIAKSLYRIKNNGKQSEKMGKCFTWLDKYFKLSQKEIIIVSPCFHFQKYKENKFCPFDYKDKSIDDYYSVYCALKHDRIKNIKKATLYTLTRVLGALYILNIYYANRKMSLGAEQYSLKIEKSGGSNIFNYKVAPCIDNVIIDSEKGIVPDTCIYKIIRKKSGYAIEINYRDLYDENKNMKMVNTTDIFQNYVKNNLTKKITEEQFFNNIGNESILLKKYFYENMKIKKLILLHLKR